MILLCRIYPDSNDVVLQLYRLTPAIPQNSKITSGYAENTAQRCIASGLGLTRGTLGEPAKFTVHAGNAGVGELHVKITNPGSEPIFVSLISFRF